MLRIRPHVPLLIILLVMVCAPVETMGQEGITRKQQERNLEKKAKEEKKAAKVKAKEDRKRQLEIQDKATRKRLKRNFKHAERKGGGGGPRRGPFTRRR
jgi:choline-glycine betaine transporter